MVSSGEPTRRFHFLKQIASGGFGSVFLAKVIHADGFSRLAAVKLLHPRWSENQEIVGRMRDEARLLGWLRHRNIVDVLDLTLISGRCAIIMEYLEAVDFKAVVQAAVTTGEPVPARAVLEAMGDVASALDAAYNRPPYAGERPLAVIHRDIKPSNVMVDDTGQVKVLDFGTARADFEARESHTKDFSFGSLEYMAPERLFFEPETPASDVYSLGASTFELLALERLGKARLRPEEHAEFIDDRLDAIYNVHGRRLDGAVLDDLLGLMADMLAFDQDDRPTAAEAGSRMRALSREMRNEMGLYEYAELAVRPLVHAWTHRAPTGDQDPLVGQVVAEDGRALMSQDGRPSVKANPQLSTHVAAEDLEDEVDETMNQRWAALKSQTMADIEEERAVASQWATQSPGPSTGARAEPAPKRSGAGCGVLLALGLGMVILGGGALALAGVLAYSQGALDGLMPAANAGDPPEPPRGPPRLRRSSRRREDRTRPS